MPGFNKNGIIYRVSSPSGKSYIGQTIQTMENRKSRHIAVSRNKKLSAYNLPICRAIRTYGENLCWEVLEECPVEQLNDKEIEYIEKYNAYSHGYNCTPGGDFNPLTLPEVRKKIGLKSKGRMVGYKPSEETLRKLRDGRRAGKNNPMYGKKRPDWLKKKLSECAKLRVGQLSSNWKLTETDKQQIKIEYFAYNEKRRVGVPGITRRLAEQYKVSKTTITNIIKDYR